MSKPMPVEPVYLKAGVTAPLIGVDRDKKILRGYVIAQVGPFKSLGRGEFDEPALDEIVRLSNAAPGGLKSRFTHPSMSDDGLGKFLGRAHNLRKDVVQVNRDGKIVELKAVRGDLHLSETAHKTPSGDLAGYVLDLAEKDSDALSSSLVVSTKKEYRLNPDGTRQKSDKGEELPPIWRPTRLHASDIVDTGDAVDGLLSASGINVDELPDALQRRGVEMLDQIFADQPRDVVESRVTAYLRRYLDLRFSDEDIEERRRKLNERIAALAAK